MKKNEVSIITTEKVKVGNIMRDPGFTLLEGISPDGVTIDHLNKASQLKKIQFVNSKTKSPVTAPEPVKSETPAPVAEPKKKATKKTSKKKTTKK